MDDKHCFLIMDLPCDQAVTWFSSQLKQMHLVVLRTFDLISALQEQNLCPCPYHGTDHCDCQMVVLLVYQEKKEPVTITVHSHNHQTWFSLVDNPQQHADPHLKAVIQSLVSLPAQSTNQEQQSVHMI